MKTQLALCVHEDVTVRHEWLLLHADARRRRIVGLAGRGQARWQHVPVVANLALAHREAALDHVLVEEARVCGGQQLALSPYTLAVICANHALGLRQVHVERVRQDLR